MGTFTPSPSAQPQHAGVCTATHTTTSTGVLHLSNSPPAASLSLKHRLLGFAAVSGVVAITIGACGDSVTDANALPPLPPGAASVASVNVSIDQSTILPGATATATASVRDAAGNSLSGRTIAWSSSAANVAIVTGAGVITAVAPGSATITATSENKQGIAALTVSQSAPPPPPPGAGGCPNEPAGYTRINEQPWDQTPIRNVQTPLGWIDDVGNGAARFSIIKDPSAPFDATKNVIAGLFPKGAPGGSAPFSTYRPFSAAEQFKNLYICLYLKHDAAFDNTNGNAGTKFIWPAGDQVGGTMTYTSHDGASMDFQMIQQGPVDRQMGGNLNAAQARMLGKRGLWVRYELLLKANTNNSTANGELHIWLDGVKTHQYANVNWQMQTSRKWMSLSWNPTYGGGTNPVPQNQYQYMDHIRISGSP